MEKSQLAYLLGNTGKLEQEITGELETIISQFPYFQAARALYLKGLHSSESLNYNRELKITAAYTVDRSVLFEYITSENFRQDKIALQIKEQEEMLQDTTISEPEQEFGRRSMDIDDAIKMKKIESDRVMDPHLFEKPVNTNSSEEIIEKPASEEMSKKPDLNLGKPLEFEPSESHSFSEWLKLTQTKPVERDDAEDSTISRNFELIDDFISKSPKISPAKNISGNLNIDRNVPPEALMTETLARVYLEQKNYKKAIQAYKILILKNPEKSGFFADQIRAIKKIQENNTSKE